MSDHEILDTMDQLGGSFMQALANLYRRADRENQLKIKTTWAEDWSTYAELTTLRLQREGKIAR